jgi:predicted RNA-binding protein YlxR (DUF448 family)
MTNEQMKEGRFLRFHKARKMIAFIKANLQAGRTVYVCTMTKATGYTAKHVDMFKATKSGAYVQAGKRWNCIDYCNLIAE